MNSIFYDVINNYLVVYLDDILMYNNIGEEHFQHLCIVLNRLENAQLYGSRTNFELEQTEIELLGRKVSRGGISIADDYNRVV